MDIGAGTKTAHEDYTRIIYQLILDPPSISLSFFKDLFMSLSV